MHLTQDQFWVWFYSMALPRERRWALEQWYYGGHAVRVHQYCHPYYANPVLGQYWMMSCSKHILVWWPWLLSVSCFAARFCHLHELGILCWGTPPNLPTAPRILDHMMSWPHACLLLKVCCCILYLLLLKSTYHDPYFMSHDPSNFCEPITTHPSHCSTLSCLNWFTIANVTMT